MSGEERTRHLCQEVRRTLEQTARLIGAAKMHVVDTHKRSAREGSPESIKRLAGLTVRAVMVACLLPSLIAPASAGIDRSADEARVFELIMSGPEKETKPLTYQEVEVDARNRRMAWTAGKWTVIVLGGMVITYFTAGVAAPWIGGVIGGTQGLTGAAGVNFGLALLGGGSIAAGGLGVAGGTAVVTLLTDLVVSAGVERAIALVEPVDGLSELTESADEAVKNPASQERRRAMYLWAGDTLEEHPRLWEYVVYTLAAADQAIATSGDSIPDAERLAAVRRSIELLNRLLEHNPVSSFALNLLGNGHLWCATGHADSNEDDYAEAVSAYAAAISVEPRDPDSYVSLSLMYRIDGRPLQASAVLAGAAPRLSSFAKEDRASIYRHIGAVSFGLIDDSPTGATYARSSYDAYQASLTNQPNLEAYISRDRSYVAYLDATQLDGDEEATKVLLRDRAELVSFLAQLSKRVEKQAILPPGVARGDFIASYRPLMEELLGDSIARVRDLGGDDQCVSLLDDLWKAYYKAVKAVGAQHWPSKGYTISVLSMVKSANDDRNVMTKMSTESYEDVLENAKVPQ